MTRFFTTLLVLCGYCLLLSGQTKVQLSIPDVISPGGDAIICAPVYADSFPNIAGVQFSVRWDTVKYETSQVPKNLKETVVLRRLDVAFAMWMIEFVDMGTIFTRISR